MRRIAAYAVAGAIGVGGCGGGDGELDIAGFDGDYTVTMVVGDAVSDPSAPAALLFEQGTSFTERWVLDCDETACTLHRPEGGEVLGDLDGLELTQPLAASDEAPSESLAGRAEGVESVPDVAEPGPCEGTAARRWTVRVDVARTDDVLSGSVIRTPDSLLVATGDTECFGVDLTLGVSGVRR